MGDSDSSATTDRPRSTRTFGLRQPDLAVNRRVERDDAPFRLQGLGSVAKIVSSYVDRLVGGDSLQAGLCVCSEEV